MTDIPATGAFYTWNNKQDPQSRIYSRLDRFLVNQKWQTTFPDMMAYFHLAGLFDHSLCTVSDAKLVMTRRASFKYFNMWGKAPDFLTRVQEEWDKNYPGHKMFNVVKKLKALKPMLKDLNKECYADIEKATKFAESELAAVQPARISFLKQKAKTQWLEDGDSNTAYFHGVMRKRFNLNKVIQIENQRGVIFSDSKGIQDALLDYYESLLGSRKSTEKVRTEVLMAILVHFFNDSWDIIGEDICDAIKDFFNSGNAKSIMLLIRAFSSFSKPSGHTMNNEKSEVYYNEVSSELKNDIHQATGFVEGSLPFRYLGVPIQAGRLSQLECNALVERMVNRIRSIGEKKLSYAGRLVLINSVLNTLYSYWAGMFIIPKGVIRRIEGICRNFLWDGSSDYHRVPLVVWEKVTLPKDEGGLGIKKAELCNITAVAKLVDWVYNKADKLWIKWISQVYLKQQDWHTYTPAAGVAWSWRSIYKVKEIMKAGYQNDQWSASSKGYSIREGYEWLRTKQPKKDWVQLVWNSWNYPKHALISWIVMNQGLNVKAKLFQFGCSPDNR
ncbi:uncharacterized protein LOC141595407 [Silene latifolia]|uniref:uncharacterized protein LOC141595407 n=1 Tax=Silene latifolia TaxID=37657 RepID=UPI003D76BBFC